MERRDFLKLFASAALLSKLPLSAQSQFHMLIPPTVHHVTETSARIYFVLAQPPMHGRLYIVDDGGLVEEVILAEDETIFTLIIENLTPATQYKYELYLSDKLPESVEGTLAWHPLIFHTPPYADPLRFVAIGDSGFGDQITQQLANHMAQQDIHLFLHLGDLVYNSDEYNNDPYFNWWYKYFEPFGEILRRVPHYPTFGNHEADAAARLGDGFAYDVMFPSLQPENGGRWYSFMIGDIRFISLDTQVYFSFPEQIEAQEAWLEEQMTQNDSRYTIAFFHVPPYHSGLRYQESSEVIQQRIVHRLERGNVKLILSGHYHMYERLYRNGIHYIVAGGGSSSIYPNGIPSEYSQFVRSTASYPLFECHQDHIDITAYDTTGEVIDQAQLSVV